MPELPEVQTIINYLKSEIIKTKIIDIEIRNPKFLKNSTVEKFKDKLIDNEFIDISRKGKYLVFSLAPSNFMVVHLRMEGKFFVDKKPFLRKHDYICFKLSNNEFLSYNDSRQFGTFHITNDLSKLKEITKIAIDPLNDNFNFDYLKNKIYNSNMNIKAILMNQEIVSGIGNIYASEILFKSKVNPLKIGKELSDEQIHRIVTNSKSILLSAIKHNGTTVHTYSFGINKSGEYGKYLNVYNRENKECLVCKAKIKRISQQQRSTFYCPKCQE